MSSSKAVAVPDLTGLPALVDTPATTIGFEDIAPPSLYIVQRSSGLSDIEGVNYGDLVIAQGADDAEPQVMWEFGSADQGVLFHPLHMYKTWTWSDGENLRFWPYGNTGQPPEDAPEGTFRTYNYVLFVPEYDTEMPVYFRLNSKSQRPAANKINLIVSRSDDPMLASAFRVTTVKREKGANKWAVPVVTDVTAEAKHVEQAVNLYNLIAPGLKARAERDEATSNAPSI